MNRIPLSSYRIQFNPAFGFNKAQEILEYLSNLGISTLYASPIFRAVKGSAHGYDVVDPNQLNPELGTREDFEALIEQVKRHGMEWIQDIVPNHMAVNYDNEMLMDVLENGRNSQYIHIFDINWNHPYESIKGKLLAPFLGGFYGETLEKGEICLSYDEFGLAVHYYNWRFSLKIESYATVFTHNLNVLQRKLGRKHPDFIKFLGILYVLKTLPSKEDGLRERYDQIKFAKGMLWELYTTNEEIRQFIDGNIEAFNGVKGNLQSFNLLDSLLSEQFFRLSFWKVATQEINYRRFFNVNGLISLRMEDDEVFEHLHALILKLIADGKVSGLRIDHIDGLYAPTNYLKKLRDKMGDSYLVVEKILESEEELPSFWPVEGTTGYDFMNHVNGLFCKRKNEKAFDRIYSGFTGFRTPYEEIIYEKRKLIIEKHMTGDVDNLVLLMKSVSSRDRHGNDITFHGLNEAIVEVLALFPVYRTYIDDSTFSKRDDSIIKQTIWKARSRTPDLLYELDYMNRILLLESYNTLTDEEKGEWMRFIMRLQQFTGPLMAKGFEDTTLYVYNRLLSLNEVGGNPDQFGVSLSKLHEFNQHRARWWPHTMNATSTHDTKRGEDVRARINVLSEIPKEWENQIKTWSKINKRKRKSIRVGVELDHNDEYFLYQTLVGAFPFEEENFPSFIDRLKQYMIKAIREAKVHTAWLKPDITYENNFLSFVEAILDFSSQNPFLESFLPFQNRIARYGIWNSLAQTLIKITSPGVPDFYQGTELWDFSFVDPDNRRPVDYKKREVLLNEILGNDQVSSLEYIAELLSNREDGRIKFFLTYKALQTRKKRSGVFCKGAYIPLETGGRWKDHIVAFARHDSHDWALTIAPRFLTSIINEEEYPLGDEIWKDTHLVLPDGAPSSWKNALTGQTVQGSRSLSMGEILQSFPVALLMNDME
jgi:(1->4)-alpha-D-glucan 1-alpha-D-glucosylmutase